MWTGQPGFDSHKGPVFFFSFCHHVQTDPLLNGCRGLFPWDINSRSLKLTIPTSSSVNAWCSVLRCPQNDLHGVEPRHRVTLYLLLNFTPARQTGDEEQTSQNNATKKKQKKVECTEKSKRKSRGRQEREHYKEETEGKGEDNYGEEPNTWR